MSDVIFNPSLLNWSSLILTVAHISLYWGHKHTTSNYCRICRLSYITSHSRDILLLLQRKPPAIPENNPLISSSPMSYLHNVDYERFNGHHCITCCTVTRRLKCQHKIKHNHHSRNISALSTHTKTYNPPSKKLITPEQNRTSS